MSAGALLLKNLVGAMAGVRLGDIAMRGSESEAELGRGVLKLPELFRFLKRNEFSGVLSVDYGGSAGLAGLRRSVEHARGVWSAVQA